MKDLKLTPEVKKAIATAEKIRDAITNTKVNADSSKSKKDETENIAKKLADRREKILKAEANDDDTEVE